MTDRQPPRKTRPKTRIHTVIESGGRTVKATLKVTQTFPTREVADAWRERVTRAIETAADASR